MALILRVSLIIAFAAELVPPTVVAATAARPQTAIRGKLVAPPNASYSAYVYVICIGVSCTSSAKRSNSVRYTKSSYKCVGISTIAG